MPLTAGRVAGARPGGGLAALMVALPPALALVAQGLVLTCGTAPRLQASFSPRHELLALLVVLAVPYAALYMLLSNRVRQSAPPRPAGRKPGRDEVSVGTIFGTGLLVGVVGVLSLSQGVLGALNELAGTVTTEPARIVIKRAKTSGKGCHHDIGVVSPTVPDGVTLCVPLPDWDRLEEGDSVPIVSIISAVGREVGLAPDALSHVTRGRP